MRFRADPDPQHCWNFKDFLLWRNSFSIAFYNNNALRSQNQTRPVAHTFVSTDFYIIAYCQPIPD